MILAIGLVIGVGLFWGLALVLHRTRRATAAPAPPKGTRPEVRVLHDDVIYDLTDTLEQLADDENGCTVWQVHGPLHLRFSDPNLQLKIREPLPQRTHVKINMVGGPDGARFATAEEIAREAQ